MSLRQKIQPPAFWQGVRDLSGLSIGIAAWGLMTGVAISNSSLGSFNGLLMATIVFAGSSQLAALPLMAADAPAWVILATAFCVNLRFVVFSAHLRSYLISRPKALRMFIGYMCADLSYVQLIRRFPQPGQTAEEQDEQLSYLLGNCALNWISWTASGWAGVLLAQHIPTNWGLGFAGLFALIGLTCSMAQGKIRIMAALLASISSVALVFLPMRLNILAAILLAVAAALWLESVLKALTDDAHN